MLIVIDLIAYMAFIISPAIYPNANKTVPTNTNILKISRIIVSVDT